MPPSPADRPSPRVLTAGLVPACVLLHLLFASACTLPASAIQGAMQAPALVAGAGEQFGNAAPVTIRGYQGDAMEPFVTRDGKYLFFNDSNDPSVDTNLHWARRIDDVTFEYAGPVPGVNSPQLDGVPSIDAEGVLYFVSPRSYGSTLSTIYRARWRGEVAEIALVPGISERVPGIVNFDVEVSADGDELVFVDGEFHRGDVVPRRADLLHAFRRGDVFVRDERSAALFAAVNTPALEYAAALSRDGSEMFFTRADPQRGVAPTIWRTGRASPTAAFGAPERVRAADGYVEGPSLSADGRTLYFHRRGPHGFSIFCIQRSEAPAPPALPQPPAADDASRGRAEDEEHGTHDAEARPQVVEPGSLAHVEHRERHEHRERDGFLHDLQLGE
jgi:Tol biopolymer transport system component